MTNIELTKDGVIIISSDECIEVKQEGKSTIHAEPVKICRCKLQKVHCDNSCKGDKNSFKIVNRKPFQTSL